jgi:molybdopterin-guanine dinucleotide biosynthesis protein B
MKVFSVCGITQSGKTTTVEKIIAELKKRGYKVGSVKEIHFEAFQIDPNPSSNTRRHREAGAELVTARGYYETDILYPEKLSMKKILSFYEGFDWVVLEGVDDIPIPTIVTAHTQDAVADKWSDYAFCVSGRIADAIQDYKGFPAISAVKDAVSLTDLVEQKVYEALPDFSSECCGSCGFSCQTLGEAILHGRAKRSDCVSECTNTRGGAAVRVDGTQIKMVPFVQKIVKNTVLAVLKELDGFKEGAKIQIEL